MVPSRKKMCFHILMKKNHKIETKVYKIQILNSYLKIISILYTFWSTVLPFNDNTICDHSRYYF